MSDFEKIGQILKENKNWNKELLENVVNNDVTIGFQFNKNGDIEYWYTLC